MTLTHFDAAGQAHMVDVSGKEPTAREAVGSFEIDASAVVVASGGIGGNHDRGRTAAAGSGRAQWRRGTVEMTPPRLVSSRTDFAL